jgi:hypothetical protein
VPALLVLEVRELVVRVPVLLVLAAAVMAGDIFIHPVKTRLTRRVWVRKRKKRARRRCRVGADLYGMGAPVIGAIDQETANASCAHLCEGDLLLACGLGHAPLKRGLVVRASGRLMRFVTLERTLSLL